MWSERRDLRYLFLAVVVVLLGLFNSGLDDNLANHNPPPHAGVMRQPLIQAAYHYRQTTKEERFYQCFGEMAMGRQYDRAFLQKHRGDLGDFEEGMLGPRVVSQPLLPYRDYIAEYPPVNFPFIAGPSLVGDSTDSYATTFRIMLGLLNIGALLIGCYLATRYLASPGQVRRFLVLSLAGALFLGPIMVTRLDPIALIFFLGALLAAAKERPVWSGISLSLAVGAKIVPLFLIPFFFLHWWMKKERAKAIRFGVSSVAGIGFIFLPALFAGPENFKALFRFHGQRPIQVESSFAAFLRLQEMFSQTSVELIHSYGSWNIRAPGSEMMASLSTPLALVTVAMMLWLYRGWLTHNPTADQATREFWLLRASAATVAGLMFFSKVFSPQYLIWMWPWVFLAGRGRTRHFSGVCLIAFGLTQLIAQPYATSMVQGQTLGTLLLAARNLALFAIVILLARRPTESEGPACEQADWGLKTALVSLALAVFALLVQLQSRALEDKWTEVRPDFKTHTFVRVEFDASPPGLVLNRGYSGVEVEPQGRTFAWTVKPQVDHFLPSTASELDHKFEFSAINALVPTQDLKLLVNGRPVDLWSDNEGWPKHWTAWVPAATLSKQGMNLLTLLTPLPVRPEHSRHDTRKLGLQMDYLVYTAIDGLALFASPPPEQVLRTFEKSDWLVRTAATQPTGGEWKKVGQTFWEAPSSVARAVTDDEPLWFYRPGNLSAGFTQLPVGQGWSKPSADRSGRSLLRFQGSGELILTVPPGLATVTFSVLKERPGPSKSRVGLSINGVDTTLKSTESEWETIYQAEFRSEGGSNRFVFTDKSGFGQDDPALGQFTLAPAR